MVYLYSYILARKITEMKGLSERIKALLPTSKASKDSNESLVEMRLFVYF